MLLFMAGIVPAFTFRRMLRQFIAAHWIFLKLAHT